MYHSIQQMAGECRENLSLDSVESASVLLSVIKLKDSLHIQQLKGMFSHYISMLLNIY